MKSDATVGEMMRRCLKEFGYLPMITSEGADGYYAIDDVYCWQRYARKSKNLESLLAEFYNWAIEVRRLSRVSRHLSELKAMADQEEMAEKFENTKPILKQERVAS